LEVSQAIRRGEYEDYTERQLRDALLTWQQAIHGDERIESPAGARQ
jgi:hypothetical protein